MALKNNITIEGSGIPVPECYIKIKGFEKQDFFDTLSQKALEKMVISVLFYYNEQARIDGKAYFLCKYYSILNKINSLQEGYDYLKTLDEFKDSINI